MLTTSEVFLGVLYILFATFLQVQNYFIIKGEKIKCGNKAFPVSTSPLPQVMFIIIQQFITNK